MSRSLGYFRKLFYGATALNAFSFNLIVGNLVMLFLVEVNASDTSKGFIAALAWFSLFFLIPGKFFIRRLGVVKTLGVLWIVRSLAIAPMVLAVILLKAQVLSPNGAVLFTILAQAGFQIFRGIGMSANGPLFYHLTDQNNRSRFFTNLQILGNLSAMLVLIFSALMFRYTPDPLDSYAIFYPLGCLLGIITGLLYLQQQEPSGDRNSPQEPLSKTLSDMWKDRHCRNFLIIFALVSLASSAQGGFLIVFMREVSQFNDSRLLLYALGGPGSMIIFGLLFSPLLDRIGPKPFSQIYLVILALVSVTALLHAVVPLKYLPLLYIGLFAGTTLGAAGSDSSLQAYFFNTFYRAENLNLGIILHLAQAIGGLGLISSGMLLDLLQSFSLSTTVKYNFFFSLTLLLLLLTLFLTRRLEQAGDFGMRRTLKVLFSPREWYGLWLLSNLERQPSPSREQSILSQIERCGARHIVASDYFRRLNAPDLLIREEVLNGLRNMPLTKKMQRQLIEHMEKSPFTTAARAAALLGRQRVLEAVPALKRGLSSVDYNLQAEAALALARIGEVTALPLIRELLLHSSNQRVVIYTINAIKILGNLNDDAPLLLQLWQKWHEVPQIEREVTLVLAVLLRCEDRFFSRYFELCERRSPCWQKLWKKFFPNPTSSEQRVLINSAEPEPPWLRNQVLCAWLSHMLPEHLARTAPQHPLLQLAPQLNLPYWKCENGLFLLLCLVV